MPRRLVEAISEIALTEYRSDCTRHDPGGREILLGPHFIVGSRTNVCRVYLHVDKERL